MSEIETRPDVVPGPRAAPLDETVEVSADVLGPEPEPKPAAPDESVVEGPSAGTVRIPAESGWLAARVPALGQAPWILALSAAGVAVVALAYAGGRSGAGW